MIVAVSTAVAVSESGIVGMAVEAVAVVEPTPVWYPEIVPFVTVALAVELSPPITRVTIMVGTKSAGESDMEALT